MVKVASDFHPAKSNNEFSVLILLKLLMAFFTAHYSLLFKSLFLLFMVVSGYSPVTQVTPFLSSLMPPFPLPGLYFLEYPKAILRPFICLNSLLQRYHPLTWLEMVSISL